MARNADPPSPEVSDIRVATDSCRDDDETSMAAAHGTTADGNVDDVAEAHGPGHGDSAEDTAGLQAGRTGVSMRTALILSVTIIALLTGLVGWLGYRVHKSDAVQQQREQFVEAGRQGALDLTTIDYTRVDADVARVLDSATDTFYDEFKQRSQPFVQAVKEAQSKSQGTITEAGLESVTGDEAQVLVTVRVNTSLAGVPEQQPRGWRMRINVKKVDNLIKVSNVLFVQ
jgi:Mce-associated membrane protein